MGVTTPHRHPFTDGPQRPGPLALGAAPQGNPAPPQGETIVRPEPPPGPPRQWIVVGPRTRAHMAALLETPLSAVWVALLETSGVPQGAEYRLVIAEAHLEPATPAQGDGKPPR